MPYTAAHAQRSRTDFPALLRPREGVDLAFLDGPGGSQVPTAVIEAIADFYASCNVNTHGNFPPSREVDRRMQIARETLATFLGAAVRRLHFIRPKHDHALLRLEYGDRPHLEAAATKYSSRSSIMRQIAARGCALRSAVRSYGKCA